MAVLTVIGDALLDRDLVGRVERVAPDRPVPVLEDVQDVARPGGAALAATLAAGLRPDRAAVRLVAATAPDASGAELRHLLAAAGVALVDLGLATPTPEKIRLRTSDHALARIDRGGHDDEVGAWTEAAAAALAGADAVLVSDYGRGLCRVPEVRQAIAAAARRVPVVWDPHVRGGDPVAGLDLVTPNEHEAARFAALGPHLASAPSPQAAPAQPSSEIGTLASWGRHLAQRWRSAVAVTASDRGALLVDGDGPPALVPTRAADGDACGAGDLLAGALALARARGQDRLDALHEAVQMATAYVAARRPGAAPGAAPGLDLAASGPAPAPAAAALAADVRRRGGTVVAAGGCFDLLHAGHVALLQAARRMGDVLVVCMNSDRSVRRLKGSPRPVNREADRAAVLLGLGCVDAVEVFDEDTPCAALERIRPQLFAKGDDYRGATLPEAATLAQWAGEIVLLPRVAGHSTTRLIERVAARATA